MGKENSIELLENLESYLTPERKARMAEVLPWRTRHITVVLEDIFQPHNASAVLRTCDCFGIHDVHIIENRNEFTPDNKVERGSLQWLDLHQYSEPNTDNTTACLQDLKAKGYRICATSPLPGSYSPSTLPIDQPIALLFGTEMKGLTPKAFELADEYIHIPMFGFTQSFNISVSASICLYDLTRRLHESEIDWKLSPEEAFETRLNWVRQAIRRFGQVEEKFLNDKENQA